MPFKLDIGELLTTMLKFKLLSDEMKMKEGAEATSQTKYMEDYPAQSWQELERTFGTPEVERYMKARGITRPELPYGKVKSPYSGQVSSQQETKPPGYSPTRVAEAEKLKYLLEPGKAREQVEIVAGERRSKVEQEKFDVEKAKSRLSSIHALANLKLTHKVNGETVDATTQDIEEYVDSIMKGEKPTKKFEPSITEQKMWQITYDLTSKYTYLHGKKIQDLSPEEHKALMLLSKFGSAKLGEDGTIQMIEVKKPEIEVKTIPDPVNPDTRNRVQLYKNGVLITEISQSREAPEQPKLLPEGQTKALERIAARTWINQAYEAYASKPENKGRVNFKTFLDSVSPADPFSGVSEPSLPAIIRELPDNLKRHAETAIQDASRLMTSKIELDPTSAYNRAHREYESKHTKSIITFSDGITTWKIPAEDIPAFQKKHPNAKRIK